MDLVKGGKVTSTSPLLMGEKLFDLFTQFIWAFRLLVLPVVRTGRLPVLIHFVSSDLAHRLSTSVLKSALTDTSNVFGCWVLLGVILHDQPPLRWCPYSHRYI